MSAATGGAARPYAPGVTLGASRDQRFASMEPSQYGSDYSVPHKVGINAEAHAARVRALARFYEKNERKGVGL